MQFANVSVVSKVAIPLIAENVLPTAPRGAEILVRGLINNNVNTFFGLPGGAITKEIQTTFFDVVNWRDERFTKSLYPVEKFVAA